jgi:hypothetical protein
MFDVDRNSVKYAIHTKHHTQSINYVLFRYYLSMPVDRP